MASEENYTKRLHSRFREDGSLEGFSSEEALALLLSYTVPDTGKGSAAELSHELLKGCCGSISTLLSSSMGELLATPGINRKTAVFLRLVMDITCRYSLSVCDSPALYSSEKAGAYLIPLFKYEKEELLIAVCVDRRYNVISSHKLSRGSVNSADISIRKIMEIALTQHADGIIIAHNHLSGVAIPSEYDLAATQAISDALASIGIVLVDHIITAGGDFVSFRDSGFIFPPPNLNGNTSSRKSS